MTIAIEPRQIEKSCTYYDEIYRAGYNTAHMQPIYNAVIEMLMDIDNLRVLEIGCGTGVFGEMVVDFGINYRGFDFSLEAIRHCPSRIRTRVSRRNAYHMASYRLGHNTIVAIEVMEHLDDIVVLQHIRPSTNCIFTLPNYTDEAHLRTYTDSKAIRKYYKGMIKWSHILPIEMADDPGIECGKKIIWVCKGVRL